MPLWLSIPIGHFHTILRPHVLAPTPEHTLIPTESLLQRRIQDTRHHYLWEISPVSSVFPSKGQLLVFRAPKAALWGEEGIWLCFFPGSLTALRDKGPTEKHLIDQSQSWKSVEHNLCPQWDTHLASKPVTGLGQLHTHYELSALWSLPCGPSSLRTSKVMSGQVCEV